jgi:2-polyprenyl-6-methoxyphenol hydroxylase-like FAD-dependent oxidoreductase
MTGCTTRNDRSPAARRAIISGASIAGLSVAFWLRRTGWHVHVIERAPRFRDGGQNVDIRGIARDVLRRMDLFDAVKAQNTTETGTDLVDTRGRVVGTLPNGGGDGATAELEILRGDLARTLLEHLPEGVEFTFGDIIERTEENEDHLAVRLASGQRLEADLLVIAEGVRSTTRDRIFGDSIHRRDLDVNMVFGTIPRLPSDTDRWRWHNAVGGRQIHLRPDNHGTTRAILAYSPGEDITRLDRPDALATVRRRYTDAGWETARILDAFDEAGDTDDVYVDHLVQIRADAWHRGRIVLAGDAAWCVTPMGGGGASLALISGYVLAAQLLAHPTDRAAALERYEQWLRPLVSDVQDFPTALKHFAYPQSRLALTARGLLDRALTSAPLRPFARRLTRVAETERELPAIHVAV